VGGDGQSGSGRAHHGFPSCPATGCLYPSSREAVGSSSSLPLSLPREAVGRVAHRERSETMCRVGGGSTHSNAGREFCSSRPPPDWPSASHPPHKKWGRDKKHRCAALPQQRVIIARSARDEAIHVSFAARWIFAGARNDSPEQTAASPFIPPTASRREGKEAASSPPGVPAVSLSYFCRGHLENGAGLQHVTRRADAIRRFGVLAPRTAKPAQDPLRNCSMPRAPSCSRA
jgi:hypothetical protein